MQPDERAFYARWIAANGVAEAIGLGTTFVLGVAVAPAVASATGAVVIIGGALVAVLLGTVLEGVVVGAAQARVLAARLPLTPRAWTVATAAGAGIAWTIGMVPSTVMSFVAGDAPSGQASGPGPILTSVLAAAMGLVTGPILGAAQWVVLRRVVPGARRWLWANAVAWAAGMPIIFAGMDLVPWQGPPAARILALYAVCLTAGLAVGAIHGRTLVSLARRPAP